MSANASEAAFFFIRTKKNASTFFLKAAEWGRRWHAPYIPKEICGIQKNISTQISISLNKALSLGDNMHHGMAITLK